MFLVELFESVSLEIPRQPPPNPSQKVFGVCCSRVISIATMETSPLESTWSNLEHRHASWLLIASKVHSLLANPNDLCRARQWNMRTKSD